MFKLTVRDGDRSYTITQTGDKDWPLYLTNELEEGMSLDLFRVLDRLWKEEF